MGACSSSFGLEPAGSLAEPLEPIPAQVTLDDGAVQKVGLASASLCYCLLSAPGDRSVFIDARPKTAFARSHPFGAWSLDALLSKSGGPSDSEASALRSRCDLRWAVLFGAESNPLKEAGVLNVLRLLKKSGVRPTSQLPLLLRGGVANFEARFGFCMRGAGEEKAQPLPPCPAELLEPGWAMKGKEKVRRPKPPALYLGSLSCCLQQAVAGKAKRLPAPAAALKIAAVVQLVAPDDAGNEEKVDSKDLMRGLRLLQVPVPTSAGPASQPVGASNTDARPAAQVAPPVASTLQEQEAEGAARFDQLARAAGTAAGEAAALVMQQTVPCLLCGPWSFLVAALCLAKVLPGPMRSAEELVALVKQRWPAAELDAVALAALGEVLGIRKASSAADVRQAGAAGASSQPAQPHCQAPRATTEAEILCNQLRQRLKDDPRSSEVALSTVRTALEKVLGQPREDRLRRLKSSNARVQREIMSHPEAVALLKLAGFASDSSGDLVLSTTASLQALRDVLAGVAVKVVTEKGKE